MVKRAVDETKEAWISKAIGDAERGQDGKLRWDCIKKLQAAFHGRQLAHSFRLQKRDCNCSYYTGPE